MKFSKYEIDELGFIFYSHAAGFLGALVLSVLPLSTAGHQERLIKSYKTSIRYIYLPMRVFMVLGKRSIGSKLVLTFVACQTLILKKKETNKKNQLMKFVNKTESHFLCKLSR